MSEYIKVGGACLKVDRNTKVKTICNFCKFLRQLMLDNVDHTKWSMTAGVTRYYKGKKIVNIASNGSHTIIVKIRGGAKHSTSKMG